ncbi:MAG: sodium-dependent bicarbonate transport family permease [Alphaproteobacteria bacterium]|nr:sodium-dependent bicarbonate transport family permease [Alphaproteobacteria bacterium]
MADIFTLAYANLVSPVVLFFVLGFAAALARSDLIVPEQIAKALALYLLFAIGFKGGAGVAEHGIDQKLMAAVLAGIVLSVLIPLIAFFILQRISKLSRIDAAAVAAHYGSISIVTFVAGTDAVTRLGLDYEGYLVAVAAVMESPPILVALLLIKGASLFKSDATAPEPGGRSELFREIALNGSIVMLIGAFAIGWITGPAGQEEIKPFIVDPFKGVLCLFLLDMGLVAGRGMRTGRQYLKPPVIGFGLIMPPIGAALGLVAAQMVGLSVGGTTLLMTLAASASYIAVPAALRVALPEAKPAISLTLSLGVTFPFNLIVGIPLYGAAAQAVAGG